MRAKPQNVQFVNRLHFDNDHWYRTDDPPSLVEAEGYFLSCAHIFQTGDMIRVSCIRDDGTWDKADFEVSYSSRTSVNVQRIGAWRHGGIVIMRGLKAEHLGHGTWRVVDPLGREIAKGLTKEEATGFVSRMTPAEPVAPAA